MPHRRDGAGRIPAGSGTLWAGAHPVQSQISASHILSISQHQDLPLPALSNILFPHMKFITSIHNFLITHTSYADEAYCMIT